MDQHGEKEENNSQESASAADQREETAAAESEDTSGESMDQREEEGYNADESTGLLEDDVVVGSEEASATHLAHPCSLLRACFGCLGLLGRCGDQKPPVAPVATTEAATAAAARWSQEEEAGGEKAKANKPQTPPQGFYMQEVIARVWAVAVRPRPPDDAREGSGGNGGVHH